MINFFRKTRKKLADDNRFFKYWRYAIGEIILVVIGILIAVQINNWNEARITKQKIISLFDEVQKDLLEDFKNIDESILFYKLKDSLAYLVLHNKLSNEDYKNLELGDELFHLTISYSRFQINTRGYSKLVDNMDDIPVAYDSIFIDLKTFYEQNADRFKKQIGRIDNLVYGNTHKLSKSKKWYSLDFRDWFTNDTIINYYLNDPYYKNQVKEYNIVTNLLLPSTKIEVIKLYQLIEAKKETSDPLPTVMENIMITPEILKEYAGTYEIQDSISINGEHINELFTVNDKGMFYGDYEIPVFQYSRDKFRDVEQINRHLTFERDGEKVIIGLTWDYYFHKMKMKKIK